MGKPTGFMDYKRQELALRPPQERIKDWLQVIWEMRFRNKYVQ